MEKDSGSPVFLFYGQTGISSKFAPGAQSAMSLRWKMIKARAKKTVPTAIAAAFWPNSTGGISKPPWEGRCAAARLPRGSSRNSGCMSSLKTASAPSPAKPPFSAASRMNNSA